MIEYADELKLQRLADLTKPQVETFLRELTASTEHIETVVGQIATMSELYRMVQRELLDDGIAFNLAGLRSALKLANTLWKEVKGRDFVHEHEGYQPFLDEDIEQIMGVSLHYIRRLAKPLLHAHREVTRIWEDNGYRFGKGGGNGARRVADDVPAMIDNLGLEDPSMTMPYWPPATGRDLGVHVRLLQGLCIVTIAFFTLARRSELLALKAADCLSQNEEGEWILHGRVFKGEDDVQGRQASWPVPKIVADAVLVLREIRSVMSLRSDSQIGLPLNHDSLLTSTSYSFADEDAEPGEERLRQIEPLSNGAINSIARDLKLFMFPNVEGPVALHRFRKTSARLVALTVEGSSLILKNILHHDSPRTTLHYMFASPLMQQELTMLWPEISASNLRELYARRNELVGAGVANITAVPRRLGIASAQAESDLEVAEEEFVSLGAEMMEKGHMVLSRLGVGIWCLKPALERGNCSTGSQDIIPNGGRCSVQCRFHIQDNRRTAANLSDLADIEAKLASPDLSQPIRALYQRYKAELLTIIPTEALPACPIKQ